VALVWFFGVCMTCAFKCQESVTVHSSSQRAFKYSGISTDILPNSRRRTAGRTIAKTDRYAQFQSRERCACYAVLANQPWMSSVRRPSLEPLCFLSRGPRRSSAVAGARKQRSRSQPRGRSRERRSERRSHLQRMGRHARRLCQRANSAASHGLRHSAELQRRFVCSQGTDSVSNRSKAVPSSPGSSGRSTRPSAGQRGVAHSEGELRRRRAHDSSVFILAYRELHL
jgi:hypothetical protein